MIGRWLTWRDRRLLVEVETETRQIGGWVAMSHSDEKRAACLAQAGHLQESILIGDIKRYTLADHAKAAA